MFSNVRKKQCDPSFFTNRVQVVVVVVQFGKIGKNLLLLIGHFQRVVEGYCRGNVN